MKKCFRHLVISPSPNFEPVLGVSGFSSLVRFWHFRVQEARITGSLIEQTKPTCQTCYVEIFHLWLHLLLRQAFSWTLLWRVCFFFFCKHVCFSVRFYFNLTAFLAVLFFCWWLSLGWFFSSSETKNWSWGSCLAQVPFWNIWVKIYSGSDIGMINFLLIQCGCQVFNHSTYKR